MENPKNVGCSCWCLDCHREIITFQTQWMRPAPPDNSIVVAMCPADASLWAPILGPLYRKSNATALQHDPMEDLRLILMQGEQNNA